MDANKPQGPALDEDCAMFIAMATGGWVSPDTAVSEDLHPHALHSPRPQQRTRPSQRQIHSNRQIDMSKIKAIGFDLDFTLAVYNTEFTRMAFNFAAQRLVDHYGYPREITSFEYEPEFALKGVFVDKFNGCILKTDELGFIKYAVHGKRQMSKANIHKLYPNRCIRLLDKNYSVRYALISTYFNYANLCLYCDLVAYFEHHLTPSESSGQPGPGAACATQEACAYTDRFLGTAEDGPTTDSGTTDPNLTSDTAEQVITSIKARKISYESMWNDVVEAIDFCHNIEGPLKVETMRHPSKYIVHSKEVALLLRKLRACGKEVFLLTNSDAVYTHVVCRYLLGEDWTDAFDYIVTDSRKPKFFSAKRQFREMLQTGTRDGAPAYTAALALVDEPLARHKVYCGGNIDLFHKLTGLVGREILYCGDHIEGDVTVPRSEFWRTLLVCPEVYTDTRNLIHNMDLYRDLREIEKKEADIITKYALGDPVAEADKTVLEDVKVRVKAITSRIDLLNNRYFGNIFSTSSNLSWYGGQTKSLCDLYTSTIVNLLNYPAKYVFGSSLVIRFMPHYLKVMRTLDADTCQGSALMKEAKFV